MWQRCGKERVSLRPAAWGRALHGPVGRSGTHPIIVNVNCSDAAPSPYLKLQGRSRRGVQRTRFSCAANFALRAASATVGPKAGGAATWWHAPQAPSESRVRTTQSLRVVGLLAASHRPFNTRHFALFETAVRHRTRGGAGMVHGPSARKAQAERGDRRWFLLPASPCATDTHTAMPLRGRDLWRGCSCLAGSQIWTLPEPYLKKREKTR